MRSKKNLELLLGVSAKRISNYIRRFEQSEDRSPHCQNAPNNPDLDPIKHVLDTAKQYVQNPSHFTEQELHLAVKDAWETIKIRAMW
jgi:hypothetical protein